MAADWWKRVERDEMLLLRLKGVGQKCAGSHQQLTDRRMSELVIDSIAYTFSTYDLMPFELCEVLGKQGGFEFGVVQDFADRRGPAISRKNLDRKSVV